jgi:hypothetical protein
MGCMADVRPVRTGDDRCTGSESTSAHGYPVQEMTERRLVVLEP